MLKMKDGDSAERWLTLHSDAGSVGGKIRVSDGVMTWDNGSLKVQTKTEQDEASTVSHVTGTIRNLSDHPVTVYSLFLKYQMAGGDYEVYTQSNGWQTESCGAWQKLVTTISTRGESVRNASGATPMLALWSNQSERGTVFHLISDPLWEMRVTRGADGSEQARVEAELGFCSTNLAMKLEPAQEIELPELLYYTAKRKTDLDCYKLHRYMNHRFPRKETPILYNTWLCRFDQITTENVCNQIERAKQLGVEYFVIDAGWFGAEGKEWYASRGDWYEKQDSAFCGHMREVADKVREAGMQFGFWIEAECAVPSADIVKERPELFLNHGTYFLDFGKKEARDYMLETVTRLVETYDAKFIKFDFNADMRDDSEHAAYRAYGEGYRLFLQQVREKYPDLYLTSCASGGQRMTLRDGRLIDSYWLSDNQSPYHGLRIVKDTIKRLPPSWIERWAVILSYQSPLPTTAYYFGEAEKLVATDGAIWSDVASVHRSLLCGFLSGGPVGFSCDLNTVSEETLAYMTDFVKSYKEERAFWQNAEAHILTDTDEELVFAYADEKLDKEKILIFTMRMHQCEIPVFPVVSQEPGARYRVERDGKSEVYSAEALSENGLVVSLDGSYNAITLTLTREA